MPSPYESMAAMQGYEMYERSLGRRLRYSGLPMPRTEKECYAICEELDYRLERAEQMSRGPVGYMGPMEVVMRKESPPSIPYVLPIAAPADTQRLLLV